jgi:ACS family glucarate transporter-like MFS transporter
MKTTGQSEKKTNVRYAILTILFFVTAVNYVDRSVMGLAGPFMRKELMVDSVTFGLILSAFNWPYTFLQIPGGWILDKLGARLVGGIGLILWSLFTLFQGYVGSVVALVIMRTVVGVMEAPSFPANSRLTTMWFPQHERGKAVQIYNSAQYFGLAVAMPLLAMLMQKFGWHSMFLASGLSGIVMSILWFAVIRDPKDHQRVNKAEIDYIVQGGGLADVKSNTEKIKWSQVRLLLTNRQMIGIYIAQFASNTILWFFLTWLPTYLIQAKHLSILKAGFITSLTYMAAFAGGIFSGYISDLLLKKGKSLTVARKTPIIIGFLLCSTIILANFTKSATVVIIILTITFFAKGMAGLSWALVGDMSPKHLVGINAGIFNTAGNLAGIVIPILVGYILKATKSFNLALTFICVILLIGALCYIFVVDKVERLEFPEENEKANNMGI